MCVSNVYYVFLVKYSTVKVFNEKSLKFIKVEGKSYNTKSYLLTLLELYKHMYLQMSSIIKFRKQKGESIVTMIGFSQHFVKKM